MYRQSFEQSYEAAYIGGTGEQKPPPIQTGKTKWSPQGVPKYLTSGVDIMHTPPTVVLARDGDVGFYMDEGAPATPVCEIEIEIGGVPVRGGPLVIRPGRLTSFFPGSSDFFPILGIASSQVRVHGDPALMPHVSAVYGLLQPPVRRWIATATHALPGGARVQGGCFGYVS